jgi:hypothetical protein
MQDNLENAKNNRRSHIYMLFTTCTIHITAVQRSALLAKTSLLHHYSTPVTITVKAISEPSSAPL